ncbi:hypothetical protein HZH68_011769 [Vespula germanica]|uniref:Uncharacterized protein n=1 Tax=Vespula germanica TaxID=30212 RepID=A0A834MYL8_VESGE|nr:hypothetical protein HZH68_011769 [Vespula germanica]
MISVSFIDKENFGKVSVVKTTLRGLEQVTDPQQQQQQQQQHRVRPSRLSKRSAQGRFRDHGSMDAILDLSRIRCRDGDGGGGGASSAPASPGSSLKFNAKVKAA